MRKHPRGPVLVQSEAPDRRSRGDFWRGGLLPLLPDDAAGAGSPGRCSQGEPRSRRCRSSLWTSQQPAVSRTDVDGIDVLHLEDRSLPLVTIHAYFRGGYGRFGRETYAAAMGLPALLRYGGTTSRSASDVDEDLAYHAHQLSFGSAGGSVTSSLNTLTRNLETGLMLWGDMLTRPGFAGTKSMVGARGSSKASLDGSTILLDWPTRN